MKGQRKTIQTLFLINLALLITHEIDSAYWHEWDLFGLPGGIQLFLILNFLMMLVGLVGFQQFLLRRNSAFFFSLLVSALGLFAAVIHTIFLLAGRPEFRQAASILVLALILVISLIQGLLTMRNKAEI